MLVSEDVAGSIGDGRFEFTPIGPVELKGVAEPFRLHAVARKT